MNRCLFMRQLIYLFTFAISLSSSAQKLTEGVELHTEASATVSNGDNAPLWLSANRQGLVSVRQNSLYERVGLFRKIDNDSLMNFRLGYGLDVLYSQNAETDVSVHQAYAEIGWKKLLLTVGQKERQIDLRNNELTSGGLSQGINARPIPEVLLDVDYFSIPLTNHWWKWRFRGGFGMTTDGAWQKRWAKSGTRYTSNCLYHEKALYWKFGREEVLPLTFEIGIQMQTQFGGTSYNTGGRGYEGINTISHPENLNAFWHAFWPMGSQDETDGLHPNAAGNTLGSYNMRLSWSPGKYAVKAYFERQFEDASMLTLQYGIYDHLLGIEAELPENPFLKTIVVEHLSSKDQSGAVYHDESPSLPDHICGRDNYYNHHLYSGWQNYGMGIGNPLLTSPIYNSDHCLEFRNNRVAAWHVGLSGEPMKNLSWRALASFSRNYGTYVTPLDDILSQTYLMGEATYSMRRLALTLAIGYDSGHLVGNSFGAQLTVSRKFSIGK